MTVTNNKKAGYMNGTIGTVELIEADKLHVKTTQGQMIVVEREQVTSFSDESEYIKIVSFDEFLYIQIFLQDTRVF